MIVLVIVLVGAFAGVFILFVNIVLGPNISKAVGYRDSVPVDHQWQMAYGESNDHVNVT